MAAASTALTGSGALTADDEIDGLDAASDDTGALHVAWRERTHVWSGADRRQRVVYRRGSGAVPAWGPRIVVAEGGGLDRPQVIAAGDGVHVLAGGRLHHWLLPAGGSAFRDLRGSGRRRARDPVESLLPEPGGGRPVLLDSGCLRAPRNAGCKPARAILAAPAAYSGSSA